MIVLFTSNTQGGIVQFAMQLLSSLNRIGEEVQVFVPKGTQYSIENQLAGKVKEYEKVKTILAHDYRIKKIVHEIKKDNPSVVWFVDSAPLSAFVSLMLGNSTSVYWTIHDAVQHPTSRNRLKNECKKILFTNKILKAACHADKIVFLSEETRKKYLQLNEAIRDKTCVLTLGAHIPCAVEKKPCEVKDQCEGYYLFFGRIDKYKGIENLLLAYKKTSRSISLIIAGAGKFTEKESQLIAETDNVLTLNRFIEDGEMLWLIRNARTVVLPYIEASQSGVLPFAYFYGVPVIVSDLPGLTQFVIDKVTGLVFKNVDELKIALDQMSENSSFMGQEAKKYYDKYMNWENNLKKFLN